MQRLSHHSEVYKCWLRYPAVNDPEKLNEYRKWCGELVSPAAAGIVLESAIEELHLGILAITGSSPQDRQSPTAAHYILLGTWGQSDAIDEALSSLSTSSADSYILKTLPLDGRKCLLVAGRSDRGTLYAAFHLLRLMQMGSALEDLDIQEAPMDGLRMINQWDNMDGSIERGYAGQSIFTKITASLAIFPGSRIMPGFCPQRESTPSPSTMSMFIITRRCSSRSRSCPRWPGSPAYSASMAS